MKTLFKMNHLLILLVACGIYFACRKDYAFVENQPSPPSPPQNLIQNPSFESNGSPTSQNWYYAWLSYPIIWTPLDTGGNAYQFVQDTPPGGGNWSYQFGGGMQAGSFIMTYITGQSGTNEYTLDVWAKFMQGCFVGQIGIQDLSSSTYPYGGKTMSLDTITQWKKYSLKDTLTTNPQDTIMIMLYNGGGGPCGPSKYRFDLIELKKISI